MSFHYDPGAEKRSLMMNRKVLCNGEATGRACVFYWAHVEKVESANADYLGRGEIFRVCGWPGFGANTQMNEMQADQLATECNQYKPRRLPMLQRPFAALKVIKDPGRFDPAFEQYNPLTPEEIKERQKLFPTPVDADPQTLAVNNVESFKKELSLDDAMKAIDPENKD